MRKSIYLGIGLGGGLGSSLRYGVSSLLNSPGGFPYGTLAVNLIGCLLLTLLYEIFLHSTGKAKQLHKALATGMIGSFTTFSAFSAESVQLFDRSPMLACYYMIATIVGGLGMTMLGHLWGRRWRI
ncbi:fluoride efflux transporter FluC [Halobacillus mangrovi]|uniref:Fluoride-specific ion channel FluC n=1 Tax=Halobacillus mangrovi TaxID=402384 RepID=A0A1W5ZTM0_9BACI|nr:CrcB family protein [Halobacillus mangrovi]ARI76654.1 hypothetical protein HM131_07285 [Halobacillus mangrovi]